MTNKSNEKLDNKDFVIITGLSGSGMTSATHAFEDLDYFCVDNLPVTMLSTFARLLIPNAEEVVAIEKAALVINIRERHFLSDFPGEIRRLEKKGLRPFVLFFEASENVIQRRFSETRRPHPAEGGEGIVAAIRDEMTAMSPVREMADLIIDTSEHTVHTLRRLLVKRFSESEDGMPLRVQIESFGHKYGSPRDSDLMFDVRHLPNPYFEPNLRELPGTDPKVIEFLNNQPEVNETIRRFTDLLVYLLPQYKREGKSYLTIGIGCTGGKHRSVMTANAIAENLNHAGLEATVVHRDIQK